MAVPISPKPPDLAMRFPALTGLRFFAAMAIVLWHSQTGYFFQYGAFQPFFPAGAVPLFFVLSGFVLTIGADKYWTWSDFFVARIARIWPAHVAALAFLILILLPGSLAFFRSAQALGLMAINGLLLQAWWPEQAVYWSYNAPSWSVSCELFFYATFPWTAVALSRQTLLRTTGIVAVIFSAIVALDTAYPNIDGVWLGEDNPVTCFVAFTVGVAVGIFRRRLRQPIVRITAGTAIQASALAFAIGSNAYFATHVIHVTFAAAAFISNFAPTPFYAALILSLARYDGLISRALSVPLIVYGGEISYSIYLFHQLIIRWHSAHLQAFAGIPIWWQYGGLLTAIFTVAALSYHLIEKPARRMIVDRWRRLRPKTGGGSGADDAAPPASRCRPR